MAAIILTRARAGFASALSYKVMLDDKCIGTVENGMTACFNVASGRYQLHVEVEAEQSLPLRSPMDTAGLRTVDIPLGTHKTYSNALEINLGYNERQAFEVRNAGGIGGFVESLFSKAHQGMSLRRK